MSNDERPFVEKHKWGIVIGLIAATIAAEGVLAVTLLPYALSVPGGFLFAIVGMGVLALGGIGGAAIVASREPDYAPAPPRQSTRHDGVMRGPGDGI